MIDRRLILNFDWTLFGIILVLTTLGVINLYSATYMVDAGITPIFMKQVYYILIGMTILAITLNIDFKTFERFAYWIYVFSILLLVMVLVSGKTGGGAKRWIGIGGFTYQPSELVKLSLILALSRYFHYRTNVGGYYLRELFVPFIIMAVPVLLIMKQPDLGTALILLAIFTTMVFVFIKVRLVSLVIVGVMGITGMPVLWHFMKDYQKMRLLTFMSPEHDPLGSGYHIIQSKIAVGSGKIFGKGFMSGTQSQLEFLPEHHTDFIFSVIAEEWGFLGSLTVVIGFLILILWGMGIARECRGRFETLLAAGIVVMFSWHFLINIGMVVGLLPVVGVPLPFFSYGGSFMITTLTGAGLLLNIRMRRFM